MAGCIDCSFDPAIPIRTVRMLRVWISGAWVFEFINRCQIWFFEYLRISELLLVSFQNLQRNGSFHQRTGKGPTPGYFKIFKELPVFIGELEKERWL
jgi:hypothetical protein